MLSWVFKVVGCWFKDSSLSLFSIWARLVLHMSEIEGGKGVVTNLFDFVGCTNDFVYSRVFIHVKAGENRVCFLYAKF
jgi:hypothetical protein